MHVKNIIISKNFILVRLHMYYMHFNSHILLVYIRNISIVKWHKFRVFLHNTCCRGEITLFSIVFRQEIASSIYGFCKSIMWTVSNWFSFTADWYLSASISLLTVVFLSPPNISVIEIRKERLVKEQQLSNMTSKCGIRIRICKLLTLFLKM